jgi:hypothetical protein
MKLDHLWASLGGIDRVAFPDLDTIHMCTTRVVFKCYNAIRDDYATILSGCTARNDLSETDSKTVSLA